MSTCSNECLSCSDIREIASTSDIGFINENFASLQADLDKALEFIRLYLVKDGCDSDTIDANFGCIVNVKDCCDNPTSAMSREAIESLIDQKLMDKNSCKAKQAPRECDYLPRGR